jgi:hypothetical protein
MNRGSHTRENCISELVPWGRLKLSNLAFKTPRFSNCSSWNRHPFLCHPSASLGMTKERVAVPCRVVTEPRHFKS